MWDALTITEAEAAGLSELAALDLAMARDFAARAQAAEDPAVASDLARSYQRRGALPTARAWRSKMRLRNDMLRAERDAPAWARTAPALAPEDAARVAARTDALRGAVRRVIWTEHEPADPSEADEDDGLGGYFLDLLEQRLEARAGDPDFGRQPLDADVRSLCRDFGLDPGLAGRWRELPEAPSDGPPEGPHEPHAEPPWPDSG